MSTQQPSIVQRKHDRHPSRETRQRKQVEVAPEEVVQMDDIRSLAGQIENAVASGKWKSSMPYRAKSALRGCAIKRAMLATSFAPATFPLTATSRRLRADQLRAHLPACRSLRTSSTSASDVRFAPTA